MATKAEQFKALVQRSGKPRRRKAAIKTHVHPDDVRNLSDRAARKAEVKLEPSASGRPSRKSTRRSVNKGKLATSLERRQIRRASSPQTRAARASAARTH